MIRDPGSKKKTYSEFRMPDTDAGAKKHRIQDPGSGVATGKKSKYKKQIERGKVTSTST
jgi:hypothetical protein